MSETIYTIPINEAFEKYDGCPLCRLRAKLEQDSVEYVMGAAMMEPDVRAETNRLGFCSVHFSRMFALRNRLSLALILETHLDEVRERISSPASGGKRLLRKAQVSQDAGTAMTEFSESCYICSRVNSFEEKYIENVLYLWKSDRNFREKLKSQPYFCLAHAGVLLTSATSSLGASAYEELYSAVVSVEEKYIGELRDDVHSFTRSFDHRNNGVPMTEAQRTSPERAVRLLTGAE